MLVKLENVFMSVRIQDDLQTRKLT